jgi:hypothetical protein
VPLGGNMKSGKEKKRKCEKLKRKILVDAVKRENMEIGKETTGT